MKSKINFFASCLSVSLALGIGSVATIANAEDAPKLPPVSSATGVTYEKDIKSIFDTSCVKCHHGEKPKAKLSMDTLEGVLKGSKEGKVVIPGKSAESKLVLSIAYVGEEDDYMPPVHNKAGIKKLTDDQIGLIRAWIDQGAK
jgi:mono/diheme cytochrome c family protein